ncbi:hypothetical protein ABGB16_04685 [Micromonospora sp. B11E3]|uniref:hypothetical protein n=1 Tax=unclassified Micromonospora TaxID=2617518 RepID=UPI00325E6A41
MGIQRHVTSEAITGLAGDLDKDVKSQVTLAKQKIETTRIDAFPGFGLVGLPLQFAYNGMVDDFQQFLDKYSETMSEIAVTLRTKIAPAWQDAEDHNKVLYGDK